MRRCLKLGPKSEIEGEKKKKKKRKNQGTATTEKMLSIRGKNPRDSYLGRNLPTQPLLCDLTS